jgi:hypothetical protein
MILKLADEQRQALEVQPDTPVRDRVLDQMREVLHEED